MKTKASVICLLLLCSTALWSQTLTDEELTQKMTVFRTEVKQFFKDKRYDDGIRCSLKAIKFLGEQSKAYQEENSYMHASFYYDLSCLYALNNNLDEGVQALDSAIAYGFSNYKHVLADTDLDNLREDKGFLTLVDKLSESYDYLKILREAPGYTRNERTDTLPRFTYANANDSNLVRVRQYFNLDSVAGNGDEISQIKNMLTFIHNKIKHDGNHPNPKVGDAIGMADACKDGTRGLNCRGLAKVLNECYLAMGFKSRFVTCMPKVYICDCHVINAVYSPKLNKWLYIDPTQNAWVMDEEGAMLSIQEVRERLRDGRPLVLNDEANWNRNKTSKSDYLDEYMAKNLYYMSCIFNNCFNAESAQYNPADYVAIMPEGYSSEQEEGSYIVNDDAWFWQIPSDN